MRISKEGFLPSIDKNLTKEQRKALEDLLKTESRYFFLDAVSKGNSAHIGIPTFQK
jgi:hypothetical protein